MSPLGVGEGRMHALYPSDVWSHSATVVQCWISHKQDYSNMIPIYLYGTAGHGAHVYTPSTLKAKLGRLSLRLHRGTLCQRKNIMATLWPSKSHLWLSDPVALWQEIAQISEVNNVSFFSSRVCDAHSSSILSERWDGLSRTDNLMKVVPFKVAEN